MSAQAAAFLVAVERGDAADALALADAVDATLGPLVAAANAVASAPEAFRVRRAIELATAVLRAFGEVAPGLNRATPQGGG